MTQRVCVLVYGGWHGGWHWDEVAALLRAAGITVFAPTLAGLAERAGEATPPTNLSTHIADIVRVIDENGLSNITLVGHSYGGMVITGVAHERAEAIAELMYLDAFVPENGQSVGDILGQQFVAAARHAAEEVGTPHLVPPLFSVEDILGWTGERAAAFAAWMSPQPIQTGYEPVSAKGKIAIQRSFIYCNARPLGLVDSYAAAARASKDWRYFELANPHDAVHAMPAAVAGIIESIMEVS